MAGGRHAAPHHEGQRVCGAAADRLCQGRLDVRLERGVGLKVLGRRLQAGERKNRGRGWRWAGLPAALVRSGLIARRPQCTGGAAHHGGLCGCADVLLHVEILAGQLHRGRQGATRGKGMQHLSACLLSSRWHGRLLLQPAAAARGGTPARKRTAEGRRAASAPAAQWQPRRPAAALGERLRRQHLQRLRPAGGGAPGGAFWGLSASNGGYGAAGAGLQVCVWRHPPWFWQSVDRKATGGGGCKEQRRRRQRVAGRRGGTGGAAATGLGSLVRHCQAAGAQHGAARAHKVECSRRMCDRACKWSLHGALNAGMDLKPASMERVLRGSGAQCARATQHAAGCARQPRQPTCSHTQPLPRSPGSGLLASSGAMPPPVRGGGQGSVGLSSRGATGPAHAQRNLDPQLGRRTPQAAAALSPPPPPPARWRCRRRPPPRRRQRRRHRRRSGGHRHRQRCRRR